MLYNDVRPHQFHQMKGQEITVNSIKNQIKNKVFMGTSVFAGQYGSGKTTMARLVALALNCEHPDEEGNPCLECEHCKAILSGNCQDYLEVDAASNSGVDNIRKIIEDVSFMPTFLKVKVYIMDEVHMLSKAAWNSLLKTLEEPPKYAVFMLCTTEAKAIPATILSRSAVYTFRPISIGVMVEHLKEVADEYHIPADKTALEIIAKNSDGALRNALSLLEQASLNGEVKTENVLEMLGIADSSDIFQMLGNIASGNAFEAAQELTAMVEKGKVIQTVFEDMVSILSDAIMLLTSKREPKDVLVGSPESYQNDMKDFLQKVSFEKSVLLSKELMDLSLEIKQNHGGLNHAIMRIIHLCGSVQTSAVGLSERVGKLEQRMDELKELKTTEELRNASESTDKSFVEDGELANESPIVQTGGLEEESETEVLYEEDCETEDQQENVAEEVVSGKDESKTVCCTDTSSGNSFFALFGGAVRQVPVQDSLERAHAETFIEAADDDDEDVSEEEVFVGKKPENLTREEEEAIQKIEELAKKDCPFWTAINEGCKRIVENGSITYLTPLKPLKRMIESYFEVYDINATVKFDATVEL